MWTLKNKTNEQTKQNKDSVIDTENELVVARGRGGETDEIGEGD